jgi:hypothetical protein
LKDKEIKYLMFDGTVKTELTDEDQINCKGILVKEYFTPDEITKYLERDMSPAEKIRSDMIKRALNNVDGLLRVTYDPGKAL